MNSVNPVSDHLRGRKLPKYVQSHFINEGHSSKHTILPHIHKDFLELYYVYSGTNRYMVNNHFYDLKEGDIVICNQDIIHGDSSAADRNSTTYSVGMTDVCLEDLKDNHLCDDEELPIISAGAISKQVGEIFYLIYILSSDPKNLGETVNSLCCSLLLLVYAMLQSRKRHTVIRTRGSAYATAERIQKYLDTHYRENPTLKKISEELKISEYYLAHVFKDEYDVPPVQYMMERKIGEAEQILMNTATPIGDIAEYLGFSSISHFNTMFNKYVGIPPGKFRKSISEMEDNSEENSGQKS